MPPSTWIGSSPADFAHRYRHYTHGHYRVEGRDLYVNRGLSYGQRELDWCRPEITVFKTVRTAG